jgi:hypothetical protein
MIAVVRSLVCTVVGCATSLVLIAPARATDFDIARSFNACDFELAGEGGILGRHDGRSPTSGGRSIGCGGPKP